MNAPAQSEHHLAIAEVLNLTVADGLIDIETADALQLERRFQGGKIHPLVVIADQKWRSAKAPGKLLNLEVLTEWLAGVMGLDYRHIDPLKIDFTGVAEVMSSACAARFCILPVQVTTREVVIATAEPFIREWEGELRHILRKDIRRVMANPEDISRYLVELGKGNKQYDANDQHIVHIVDWLWQYAFDQHASDIHIEPRRDLGIVSFRIDGVLHQVYQIPMAVMNAMTSRIKLLGRMECRMTGYSGRVGLYEILLNSPEVRKQIKPGASIPRVREQAFREGMRPLRLSGALKVAQGLTTLEEVIKVAPPADEV